jgi:RNA polymerase sigma-70 factor (ECF subfamily)
MTRSGDAADIREMYLAGQLRWPSLSISFESFAEHWSRVVRAGEGPLEPADLYLCCACVAAHPAALESFESHNAAVAEAAIRRIDDDGDFVRDSLQELWNRVLLGQQAKLRSYSGRGPLQAWVRVAATRVALDRRRADKRHVKRTAPVLESLAASAVSPEATLLKARFGPAFQDALRKSVAGLSEQERNVLRMHVVGRCSIDEIGVAYAVHRATAARWIERAREKIYDEVRRELCVGQRLTVSEFRSLATLLGAELELSLGLGSASVVKAGGAQRGDVA